MAEAEDVLSDAARHATIYIRSLWARHRHAPAKSDLPDLRDLTERLETLIAAVMGHPYPLRIAQPPARPTLLRRLFQNGQLVPGTIALPATNGHALWLPAQLDGKDRQESVECFRLVALTQALRARRGSALIARHCRDVTERAVYTILEAHASDHHLLRILPGVRPALIALRSSALLARPHPDTLPERYRPIELLIQSVLAHPDLLLPDDVRPAQPHDNSPESSLQLARHLAPRLNGNTQTFTRWGRTALIHDLWTGDYIDTAPTSSPAAQSMLAADNEKPSPPRTARLSRRPTIREAKPDEDDTDPGAWMIQSGPPLEQAEDPLGLQRPIDRDENTPADEFADALSELPEARLVTTPQTAKDVLLSDDPPEGRATTSPQRDTPTGSSFIYPEWDYRTRSYHDPGATVHVIEPELGSEAWVDKTLAHHSTVLQAISRQFAMLRPERTRLRRQDDGDDIDLDAYIDARADQQAGRSMPQGLYERLSRGKRDTAIMLLIDISGSTDSWLSADKRIIDIEREALLLVCTALEGTGDPYSVQAFSGEGQKGVVISTLKHYTETYSRTIARRIAALEPDRYTRAGAALRHATATLMRQPARHRLLLLLSDGKPNDADLYEGRYGVEDLRQAVNEARLQGISPFCLTIDRRAADYLPAVFGTQHYALLPKSEHLPTVLLEWMRRLLAH